MTIQQKTFAINSEEKLNSMWKARFCYWPKLWEIGKIEPREAEKTALSLARRGVNAVMLSHYHFRFDFVHLFPEIEATTKIVVEACHKQGMLAVEHHSSNITTNNGRYKQWRLRDFAPRDIRTGATGYVPIYNNAWYSCINNPNWKEAYFDYISNFIKNTGADGLMHDDIHFAPGWFYCACQYCREKFKKIFGYALPGGKEYPAWDNFEHPVWRDWLMFRRISTQDEFLDMKKLLGPGQILFGCCSVGINSTLGVHDPGYAYEDFAQGANVLYEESICHPRNETPLETYTFYNWKRFFLDRKYYQALSEAKGLPCIAYFYPPSLAENFFCWALAKSFGHGYIAAAEDREKVFKWEKPHESLFEKPVDLADIGILHSAATMTLSGADARYYLDELRGWAEAMLEDNIPFKIILADTEFSPKRLAGLKLLILPNITCLSDKQISIIKGFVKKGGNLILTHETSLYDEKGAKRKDFALKDVLGFSYKKTIKEINLPVYPVMQRKHNTILKDAGERIQYFGPQVIASAPRKFSDIIAWIEKYNLFGVDAPDPAIMEGKYQKGRFVYFSFKPGLMYATEGVVPLITKDYRKEPIKQKELPVAPLWIDERIPVYKNILINSIKSLVPAKDFFLVPLHVPQGVMINSYRLEAGSIVISLLNVKGASLKPGQKMPLKQVLKYPQVKEPVQIKLNVKSIKKVALISPDFTGEKTIRAKSVRGGYVLNISSSFIKRFLIVQVMLD